MEADRGSADRLLSGRTISISHGVFLRAQCCGVTGVHEAVELVTFESGAQLRVAR